MRYRRTFPAACVAGLTLVASCATIPDFTIRSTMGEDGGIGVDGGTRADDASGAAKHYHFVSAPIAANFALQAPQLSASEACKKEADTSPLLRGRTWKALIAWTDKLGYSQGGPPTIAPVAGGWYNVRGEILFSELPPKSGKRPANVLPTFSDGTKVPNDSNSDVWSGAGGYDCRDWTSNVTDPDAGSEDATGKIGNAFLEDFGAFWGENGGAELVGCAERKRLHCFEQ